MPCQSDHMEHTPREVESARVAELLAYAKRQIKETVSREITTAAKNYYGDVKKLDEWTAELCAICSNLTEDEKGKIIYDGRNPKARKLADWWDYHQEFDKKRIAIEKEDKKNARLRKAALSKLSPEEIDVLGIK